MEKKKKPASAEMRARRQAKRASTKAASTKAVKTGKKEMDGEDMSDGPAFGRRRKARKAARQERRSARKEARGERKAARKEKRSARREAIKSGASGLLGGRRKAKRKARKAKMEASDSDSQGRTGRKQVKGREERRAKRKARKEARAGMTPQEIKAKKAARKAKRKPLGMGGKGERTAKRQARIKSKRASTVKSMKAANPAKASTPNPAKAAAPKEKPSVAVAMYNDSKELTEDGPAIDMNTQSSEMQEGGMGMYGSKKAPSMRGMKIQYGGGLKHTSMSSYAKGNGRSGMAPRMMGHPSFINKGKTKK